MTPSRMTASLITSILRCGLNVDCVGPAIFADSLFFEDDASGNKLRRCEPVWQRAHRLWHGRVALMEPPFGDQCCGLCRGTPLPFFRDTIWSRRGVSSL